jgi:hypothetical protein
VPGNPDAFYTPVFKERNCGTHFPKHFRIGGILELSPAFAVSGEIEAQDGESASAEAVCQAPHDAVVLGAREAVKQDDPFPVGHIWKADDGGNRILGFVLEADSLVHWNSDATPGFYSIVFSS